MCLEVRVNPESLGFSDPPVQWVRQCLILWGVRKENREQVPEHLSGFWTLVCVRSADFICFMTQIRCPLNVKYVQEQDYSVTYFYNFIYLFLAILGLYCCMGFLLLWQVGLLSKLCAGFSLWWLLVAELGLQGPWASVVSAHGLSSWGSRGPEHSLSSCVSQAQLLHGMWDLLGSGTEPCLLYWQANSLPLSHQGSPGIGLFRLKCEDKTLGSLFSSWRETSELFPTSSFCWGPSTLDLIAG